MKRQLDRHKLTPYQLWKYLKTKYPEVLILVRVKDDYHAYGEDTASIKKVMGLERSDLPRKPCIVHRPILDDSLQLLTYSGFSVALADPI